MIRTLAVAAAVVLMAAAPSGQTMVFHAGADAVVLDVTVQRGKTPVPGLRAEDFEVVDSGVPQAVTYVSYSRVPIDLRLVFDTSGSITDDQLQRYLRAMMQITGALKSDDRCDILTFSTRVIELAELQAPPIAINLKRAMPRATSFYDAVGLSLVAARVDGRRQLTIVLSDADDNTSFFDDETMLEMARRTDAVSSARRGEPRRQRCQYRGTSVTSGDKRASLPESRAACAWSSVTMPQPRPRQMAS